MSAALLHFTFLLEARFKLLVLAGHCLHVHLQSLSTADSVFLLNLLRHQLTNNIIYIQRVFSISVQSDLGSDVLKIDTFHVVF